jgi:hypothetical protein
MSGVPDTGSEEIDAYGIKVAATNSGGHVAKKAAAKSAKKKGATRKRSTSKRELIAPRADKRFVKRTAKGRFKEGDDVGRSLSADRRKTAKKKTRSGYGDQGDRKRTAKSRSARKK